MNKPNKEVEEKLHKLVKKVDGDKREWTFDEKIWEVFAQELNKRDKEWEEKLKVLEDKAWKYDELCK